MNNVNIQAQQLFQQELSASERNTLNNIIHKAKQNSVTAQQLAVDASKLVTLSGERLDKQSNAGFFKRMASVISGQTSRNDLQNQSDLVHMQKIAWHYLQELQQQNLMTAQSVAIVRNNLEVLADYDIETRDFLEQVVDKLDKINELENRLKPIEKHVSLADWSKHIRAHQDVFKKQPKALRTLYLIYDFINNNFESISSSCDFNDLLITLQALDIDCAKEFQLTDFILQIIDDIEYIDGISQYKSLIKVTLGDETLDTSFIQKNISGTAFNSLYHLSDHYEEVNRILSNEKLCDTEEKKKEFIFDFFGKYIYSSFTSYTVKSLIGEIASGIMLAIDIQQDMKNSISTFNQQDATLSNETSFLIQTLPDIKNHTFFDTTKDQDEKSTYMCSFGLLFNSSASINKIGRQFLELLAEKAQSKESMRTIYGIADSELNNGFYIHALKELINSDEIFHAWIADVIYLCNLCETSIESSRCLELIGFLGMPKNTKKDLKDIELLAKTSDEKQVIEIIKRHSKKVGYWKNLIRYKAINFSSIFSEMDQLVFQAETALLDFSTNKLRPDFNHQRYFSVYTFDAYEKSGSTSESDVDEGTAETENTIKKSKRSDGARHAKVAGALTVGFLTGGVLAAGVAGVAAFGVLRNRSKIANFLQGREQETSNLNAFRDEACELADSVLRAVDGINIMLFDLGLPKIELKETYPLPDFKINNAVENYNWEDDFKSHLTKIENFLDDVSNTFSKIKQQLSLFKDGDFDRSVLGGDQI